MEAATVPTEGQPEGDPTQGAPGTGAPEAEPQQDPWHESVETRLGEVSQGMRDLLARVPEQAPEPQADLSEQWAQLYEESGGMPDAESMQQLIDAGIQRGVQEAIAPLAQEFNAMREGLTAERIDALQEEFPELQEPKNSAPLVDEVVAFAQARGIPELANDPSFVRMVHLAMKAEALAAQETPAGQGPDAHLESGSGAAPGQPEGDPFDAILNAGRSTRGPLF